VGAGIFLFPGIIAAKTGPWAWSAYLGAALLCFLIALCFAELGSMFDATGGAYLYAREAFGPFVGFLVGWIVWMAAILGWASVVTGFVNMLVPSGQGDAVSGGTEAAKLGIVVAVVAALSLLNLRGARMGALANNVFSIAKLAPLALFVAVGAVSMKTSPFAPSPGEAHPLTLSGYGTAILLAIYMFSGFEELPVPAGEVREPQRQVPRALFLVLSFAALSYAAIHLVAQGTFPDLAQARDNPLTAAAQAFMSPNLASVFALGGLISILGVNASIAFTAPRSMYALAEAGWLPRAVAAVHPRWHTPWVAILATFVLVVALPGAQAATSWLRATLGEGVPRFDLETLAKMSALASLMQYIPTCVAVMVLRVRRPEAERRFRVPGGPLIPLAALALSLALFAFADPSERGATLVGVALGVPMCGLAWLISGRAARRRR